MKQESNYYSKQIKWDDVAMVMFMIALVIVSVCMIKLAFYR